MKKLLFLLFGIFSIFYCCADDTHNLLFPIGRFYISPPSGNYGAFSFMGEVGERNFRGSGTYGVNFTPCQRFKFSGEFLTQKLKYSFLSGDTKRWVSQYALGGQYQYQIQQDRKIPFQSIDAGISYAHAFDKDLSSKNILLRGCM